MARTWGQIGGGLAEIQRGRILKGDLCGRSYSPYTLTSLPQMTYKCVMLSQLQSTTSLDMCHMVTGALLTI